MAVATEFKAATSANRHASGIGPLVAQLTHLPFPEVAEALREVTDQITLAWDVAVRQAMPQMQHLTFEELKDSTPVILLAIADALASDDPSEIRALVTHAPAQGQSRFRLNFDVVDVMQEDRLLRALTVQHIENRLGRRMDVAESAALHAAVDVMLQRSVIALVDEQKLKLRAAAEIELKFVSFLAHDLNNNLNNVTLSLSIHSMELEKAGGFADALESLGHAQRSIDDTVRGMRQMLDHERMRQSGTVATLAPVDLHEVATLVALQFAETAKAKGIKVAVQFDPGTTAISDGDLIKVVLQNLVGNGLKFSTRGTVRIGCDGGNPSGVRSLSVSDDGPGIAPEKVGSIFDAFQRGEVHGQQGVGLGLAIASQGAMLLNAKLGVESTLGIGSTFRLFFSPDSKT